MRSFSRMVRDVQPHKTSLAAVLTSMDPDTTRSVLKTAIVSICGSATACFLGALLLKWGTS